MMALLDAMFMVLAAIAAGYGLAIIAECAAQWVANWACARKVAHNG